MKEIQVEVWNAGCMLCGWTAEGMEFNKDDANAAAREVFERHLRGVHNMSLSQLREEHRGQDKN